MLFLVKKALFRNVICGVPKKYTQKYLPYIILSKMFPDFNLWTVDIKGNITFHMSQCASYQFTLLAY